MVMMTMKNGNLWRTRLPLDLMLTIVIKQLLPTIRLLVPVLRYYLLMNSPHTIRQGPASSGCKIGCKDCCMLFLFQNKRYREFEFALLLLAKGRQRGGAAQCPSR